MRRLLQSFLLVLPGPVLGAGVLGTSAVGVLDQGGQRGIPNAEPRSPSACPSQVGSYTTAALPGESSAALNIWIIPKFPQQ